MFGWRLLRDGVEPANDPRQVEAGPIDAFYPLTMPLTVGPGSISVAVTLGAQRPEGAADLIHLAVIGARARVGGLAAVAATVFLCYRSGDRMVAILGASGSTCWYACPRSFCCASAFRSSGAAIVL